MSALVMGTALAHVRNDGAEHDLAAHLSGVASRAGVFAASFGGAAQAELAGLWHDLGKYAPDFQSYLRGPASVQARAQAHEETEAEVASQKKVDHSSAGALHATLRSQERSLAIAFAVAGRGLSGGQYATAPPLPPRRHESSGLERQTC